MQRGALCVSSAITDISFGAIVPLNVLSSRSSYPPARLAKPMVLSEKVCKFLSAPPLLFVAVLGRLDEVFQEG